MKFFKTLILSTLAFGALTLNSCKKDNNNTATATISASVDGTATDFNTGAAAIKQTVSGDVVTSITGTSSNKAVITILLNGTPVAGKVYSSASANSDDEPLIYYAASNINYLNDDNSSNTVTVTITSVSSTNIQGTFKGGLVEAIVVGNATPKTKAITSGKFNVNLSSK